MQSSSNTTKQSIRSTSNENENDPSSSWNEQEYFRTPSLTNLRVSTYRRLCSSACCLNIVLLCLLVVMMIVITVLALNYYDIWPDEVKIQAHIDCGPVEGFETDGIVHYLGIPYALAPLGLNRFRKPVELSTSDLCQQAWLQSNISQTKDQLYSTKQYQSECLQLEPRTDRLHGDENCLYLNVHIPVGSTKGSRTSSLKPVVILFDGLFFMYNGQSFTRPHPLTLKQSDAIHVTFNYRIGPLGFLMHPKIGHSNLGLHDQLAVLRWVRRNIRAFGGDPVNVIVFGYGSGATCALALYYSPLGQHLFEKLWISAPTLSIPKLSRERALENSRTIFQCKKSNCPHMKFEKIDNIVKLWNWNQVEHWFKQALFNFPSLTNTTDSLTKSSASSNNPLFNGILITDGEIINTNQWHNPLYRTSLVVGQTSNELALYPTPETFHFWTSKMFHEFVEHRLTSSVPRKNQYLQTKLKTSSNFLTRPACCSNMTHFPKSLDIENEYTSFLTDGRFTCPLLNYVNQFLKPLDSGQYGTSKHRIYQYYLSGQHRQFDPYSLSTYVSQAFHGWDAMVYLRSYLNHSDYQIAELSQLFPTNKSDNDNNNNGVDDSDQYLAETSDLLNQAMFEFAWTGSITQWLPSQPDQWIMNCIDRGRLCRLQSFFVERCDFWNRLFDSQWYQLIWPV